MTYRLHNPPMYFMLEPGMNCALERNHPYPQSLSFPPSRHLPLRSVSDVLQSSNFGPVCPAVKKNANDYVKEASVGVRFDEEVVREQCFQLLPYNVNYLEAKSGGKIAVYPKRKSHAKRTPCRHNTPTSPSPCTKLEPLTARKSQPRLKGLANSTAKTRNKKGITALIPVKKEKEETSGEILVEKDPDAEKKNDSGVKISEWDEYLLSKLSENAAHWVVQSKMTPGEDQERLLKFLRSFHGSINEDVGKELVEDSVSEADFVSKPNPPNQRQYKSGDELMISKVRSILQTQDRADFPSHDEHSRPFYVPSSVSNLKSGEIEESERTVLNQTAQNISIIPYNTPSPLELKDILNPKVGDKIHESKNQYVQDWLTGGNLIHQDNSHQIKMDSDNFYVKNLRRNLPHRSTDWVTNEKENNGNNSVSDKHRKGFERWQKLPDKIERDFGRPPRNEASSEAVGRKNAVDERRIELKTAMTEIANEWIAHLRIDLHGAEKTIEELIKEMGNIHVNARLGAIVTCAKAMERVAFDRKRSSDGVAAIPEELCIALVLCLTDESDRVHLAAAILLYVLERPLLEAEKVLRAALLEGNTMDRWTAARCLAHYGGCDFDVVGELVNQLFTSKDDDRKRRSTDHLVRLSQYSTLVHSMVAEKLNSWSWRQRQTACKTISVLQGDVNKDLIAKLCHLMWNDWHKRIRRAAAQALGKIGHGVDVHHLLVDKLSSGDLRAKLDAVARIGDIGIMTGKLFPIFLRYFDDENSSVRMEACVASMNLHLVNDEIQAKLISLAANDRIWKVKALAIQALGVVGKVTEELRKTLLWAFSYSTEEAVRADACRSITALRLQGKEIGCTLQDRYLVERSDLVKREIVRSFAAYGISPNEEIPILTQIKTEVRRLGTSENIQFNILANEIEENHEADKKRMIYLGSENRKKHSTVSIQPRESMLQKVRASLIYLQTPSGQIHSPRGLPSSSDSSCYGEEDANEVVVSQITASTSSLFNGYRLYQPDSKNSIQRETDSARILQVASLATDKRNSNLVENPDMSSPEKEDVISENQNQSRGSLGEVTSNSMPKEEQNSGQNIVQSNPEVFSDASSDDSFIY